MAQDAVFASKRSREGSRIADLDFQSAFNLLCMDWVENVLRKKRLNEAMLNPINWLYNNSKTIPVINSNLEEPVMNSWRTLCQGDCPNSQWFCYQKDRYA